ncbi:MAG: hypothetical protein AAF556_10500, partial [Pseudomonadota bacterium]
MAALASNSRSTRVRVTRRLPETVETRLMELFSTTLNGDDTPLDAEGLKAAVADCNVLVPTVTDRIDADVIGAAGPNLKLIASFGTGVDHIDLKAAQAKEAMSFKFGPAAPITSASIRSVTVGTSTLQSATA